MNDWRALAEIVGAPLRTANGERAGLTASAVPRIICARGCRAAAAVAVAADRHDGTPHHHAAEGDDKSEQQQAERHSGRTVGEDEVAQSVRIEGEQSAEHQHGRRRTQREINGEQAKQWLAKKTHGSGSVFHRCLNRTTADYSGLTVRLRRPAPTFCTRAAPA